MKTVTNYFVRDPINKPKYQNRISQELEIIEAKGFSKCYLQVQKIISITKNKGILHILRGSAASSYVAYLMGIHDIDPIKHEIPLERFLNWTRNKQPDFDIDFPYDIRDDIIKKLRQLYPDRVARISNRVMYRDKSAARQALKDFGVVGHIPKYFEIEDYFSDPRIIAKVENRIEELKGTQKMWMKHCGGIVIFDDEVPKDLILERDSNQIAADKNDVENKGWIKIDILSNRGLAQLRDLDSRPLSKYDFEDSKASNLLCNGKVIGLTQAESRTMRKAIMAIQPTRMEEVALALALIRPAAAAGGRKHSFLKEYSDDKIQDQIVFDDDAIKFIADISGCSYSKADEYRRGFSNNDDDIIDQFVKEINWRSDRQDIINELYYLRKYSFAKGHALAYAQMVWALAYHKARDPKSFWRSTLSHCHSSYNKWVHKREAINAGVRLKNKVGRSSVKQLLSTGWWDGKEFLPEMGVQKDGGRTYFKGVFGSFRRYNQFGERTVLGMIGVGNGQYEDLVITGKYPRGYYRFIEGWGYRKERINTSYIDVKDFYCSNPNSRSSKKLRNKFFW